MSLCVWPCNCYQKNDSAKPDFMWDADLYARLDAADAWAIIGPVNWYGPTSNLKLLFDRLVCINGGNPDEKLIDHKNPEKAMALEHSEQWNELSLNHLKGRTVAFFVMAMMAAMNWMLPAGLKFCSIKITLILTKSHTKMTGWLINRWYGSAGMEV